MYESKHYRCISCDHRWPILVAKRERVIKSGDMPRIFIISTNTGKKTRVACPKCGMREVVFY